LPNPLSRESFPRVQNQTLRNLFIANQLRTALHAPSHYTLLAPRTLPDSTYMYLLSLSRKLPSANSTCGGGYDMIAMLNDLHWKMAGNLPV